jgi:hypothetical protein
MAQIFRRLLRPKPRRVVERALILHSMALVARSMPLRDTAEQELAAAGPAERDELERHATRMRDETWDRLGALRASLADSERAFFRATMIEVTHQQQVDASWKLEAFQVMSWALGLCDELPHYDVESDEEILTSFPPVPLERLFASAALRPYDEISLERTKAEAWDLRNFMRENLQDALAAPPSPETEAEVRRIVEGVPEVAAAAHHDGLIPELMDDDYVAFGKPYRDLPLEEWSIVRSIAIERHRALNWLCGYAPSNDWDRTPMNE